MKLKTNPRADSCDDLDYSQEFSVGYQPHKVGVYKICIDTVISNVGQFTSAIQALDMANSDDDVEIHLQTPGGNLHATGALLHAMRKCAAPIHIIATGGVHSAGTMILLQADTFELSEDFHALIHCGSMGIGGTLNEYHAQAAFHGEFFNNIHRKSYEGFLSPCEIERMIRGEDFWLDADVWCERHKARNEYFMAKAEAAKKPVRKPRKKKIIE